MLSFGAVNYIRKEYHQSLVLPSGWYPKTETAQHNIRIDLPQFCIKYRLHKSFRKEPTVERVAEQKHLRLFHHKHNNVLPG